MNEDQDQALANGRLSLGVDEDDHEDNSIKRLDPSMKDMILSLIRGRFSPLEKLQREIFELKARMLEKEQELEAAIAQSKVVMNFVAESSPESIRELMRGADENDNGVGGINSTDGEDNTATSPVHDDMPTNLQLKMYAQGDDTTAIGQIWRNDLRFSQMSSPSTNETEVAYLTIKSQRDALTMRQYSIEEKLEEVIQDRRHIFEGCESARGELLKTRQTLEMELQEVAQEYCKMNKAVTVLSDEESNAILQSLRDDPDQSETSSPPRPPLLQKYVRVARELDQNNSQMVHLNSQMSDLRVEDQFGVLEEVKEKLRCSRELTPLPVEEAENIAREMTECDSEQRDLEASVRDLVAAMKWAKVATRGLYEPNPLTAPVMLLVFQQFCRLQIPSNQMTCMSEIGDHQSESSTTIDRLRSENAFGLNLAGYVATAAREVGYGVKELKREGYSPKEIQDAGFSLQDMKAGGITTSELKVLGYKAPQMKQVCNAKELLLAGFSTEEIKEANYSVKQMRTYGITPSEFKTMEYTASELREVCSVKELIDVEFSIEEIHRAGYTLREMKAGNIPSTNLRALGFSAIQLWQVGYSVEEVIVAGYSMEEICQAGYSLEEMQTSKISPHYLKAVFSASDLKAVGYSVADLLSGGYSIQEICEAEYSLKEMKAGGISAGSLRFKFSTFQLKGVGYTVGELRSGGFSADEVKGAGYLLNDMKSSGISSYDLKWLGYTPSQLRVDFFLATELRGGYSAGELLVGGYLGKELRLAGYSAAELKEGGCTLRELRFGGYTADECRKGGCTAQDLLSVDFTIKELRSGGYTARNLRDAGCTVRDLRGEYSCEEVKAAGYSAAEGKFGGYSTAELVAVGYPEDEIPHKPSLRKLFSNK
jgi:ribosomal protein L13E